MSNVKSPFIIIQEFLSPLICEQIVKDNFIAIPNRDKDNVPLKYEQINQKWNPLLAERFSEVVPLIEEKYNCKYKGLEQPLIQYYPENPKKPAEKPGCENSVYARKKWVMVKDVDLVGYIWLKDYNQNTPIDTDFEVYGGRLEFPQFNFNLAPQRGTLVMYPAGPHFISAISPLFVGDLYQIKFAVSVKTKNDGRYLYDPKNFPGTWHQWLEEYM